VSDDGKAPKAVPLDQAELSERSEITWSSFYFRGDRV
jgi:hypothetical protein